MNSLSKKIIIIVLALIAVTGVFFALVSFGERRTHSTHEEEFWRTSRDSPGHLAYFHAVEFLVAQAAESDRENPGLFPLPDAIQEMPMRSMDYFFIEQGKMQLEQLFNDSGFIAYLGTINLLLSREPYENIDFVFYDFMTLDEGTRIGSIGIQKRMGEIYLFDDEYISLGAIHTFGLRNSETPVGESLDLNTLPSGTYERGRTHTVLIVGTNQQLTDTIILAILNEDMQAIDLISLPRDLYYREHKINEIYFRYGPRRLVREMESMTGFEIDNFVIIDMYAFIDVINILGGVEITLEAPLIDPSYRIRENGHWSTLFYPAGTHHLNGVEALRVARSRHYIADFGRSWHQQMILSAIIDQITGLGVSDIGRVYELAMVFMRYVETDYTPQDLVRYILRFRSATVRSRGVFNTRDLLYFTHTNLLHMGLSADEVDEDFNLGQFILLPLNDDWSLIHRFIRSVIEDPVEESEEDHIEEHEEELLEDADEYEDMDENMDEPPEDENILS